VSLETLRGAACHGGATRPVPLVGLWYALECFLGSRGDIAGLDEASILELDARSLSHGRESSERDRDEYDWSE